MSKDTKQRIADLAAEADATREDPMTDGAMGAVKPNKSVTVSTRLALGDVADLEALAAQLDVPVSALLRGWILAGLHAKKEQSVGAALDRLSADVQRLRELVA